MTDYSTYGTRELIAELERRDAAQLKKDDIRLMAILVEHKTEVLSLGEEYDENQFDTYEDFEDCIDAANLIAMRAIENLITI